MWTPSPLGAEGIDMLHAERCTITTVLKNKDQVGWKITWPGDGFMSLITELHF